MDGVMAGEIELPPADCRLRQAELPVEGLDHRWEGIDRTGRGLAAEEHPGAVATGAGETLARGDRQLELDRRLELEEVGTVQVADLDQLHYVLAFGCSRSSVSGMETSAISRNAVTPPAS